MRLLHRGPIRLIIGVLIILVPTVAISSGIAALIPAEAVPRVDNLPDGGRHYVFESVRGSIMRPVALVLLVVFTILAERVVPDQRVQKMRISARSGLFKYISGIGRGLWWTIVTACWVGIVTILLKVIVLVPLFDIRAIDLDQNTASFQSLLRTWTFPRAQIVHVDVNRFEAASRRNVHLVVQLADGQSFTTIRETDALMNDRQFSRFIDTCSDAKANLLNK